MGLFTFLSLPPSEVVDWEMTPEYTFGTFESWGGRERVRSGKERIYYFFIDSWGETPKLCLMERGIKHARVVAEILAPDEMLRRCVERQGKTVYEKSFAIDEDLKQWLLANVIDSNDDSRIIPLQEDKSVDAGEIDLPQRAEAAPGLKLIMLPSSEEDYSEEDAVQLVVEKNYVEKEHNPGGEFTNYLVDNGDGLTVSDRVTGLMWQRGGTDIMSRRMLLKKVSRLNDEAFADYTDWRLPSLEEALSLLEPQLNNRDVYLNPCFSAEQPFIFVAARRQPGGYWFVDFKQARAFWSSGTIPGGFGRLCRSDTEL